MLYAVLNCKEMITLCRYVCGDDMSDPWIFVKPDVGNIYVVVVTYPQLCC